MRKIVSISLCFIMMLLFVSCAKEPTKVDPPSDLTYSTTQPTATEPQRATSALVITPNMTVSNPTTTEFNSDDITVSSAGNNSGASDDEPDVTFKNPGITKPNVATSVMPTQATTEKIPVSSSASDTTTTTKPGSSTTTTTGSPESTQPTTVEPKPKELSGDTNMISENGDGKVAFEIVTDGWNDKFVAKNGEATILLEDGSEFTADCEIEYGKNIVTINVGALDLPVGIMFTFRIPEKFIETVDASQYSLEYSFGGWIALE